MFRTVLAVCFVACSSSTTPPPPTPSGSAAPTKAVIELAEVTILFDGNPIARLHSDGRSESVGENMPGPNATFVPGPTFHADGTITMTHAGVSALVTADGEMYVIRPDKPRERYGRLSGNEILTGDASGHGFRLDATKLTMFSSNADPAVMGYVDPPTAGRTGLIMSAAFTIDLLYR